MKAERLVWVAQRFQRCDGQPNRLVVSAERRVTITKDSRPNLRSLKFHIPPPISTRMVNPISSANTTQANEAKPAAPKPQPTQQKSAPQPSDTVTLKSTAKAGSSGDIH
ncbi:MAG: hypothetical protein WAJ99_20960 [Candidatus Sulfotelmatobacter sp.]